MTKTMRYCGRDFSVNEIDIIKNLIAKDPCLCRNHLSRQFCEMVGWFKRDGGLKEMSCRVALLKMQKDGLVQLPLPRRKHANGIRAIKITGTTDPPSMSPTISDFRQLNVSIVESKIDSGLWNEYIHRYHYLGFTRLPGAQLRYIVRANDAPVAFLGFGAAAWRVAPRDLFIGWSDDQRQSRLNLVINNARFLILPWIRHKNLASHIISLVSRRLPPDWEARYAIRPVLAETFVDDNLYRGTCYRAANWKHVGKTKGRGKLDINRQYLSTVKSVWLNPLTPKFRSILCE